MSFSVSFACYDGKRVIIKRTVFSSHEVCWKQEHIWHGNLGVIHPVYFQSKSRISLYINSVESCNLLREERVCQ